MASDRTSAIGINFLLPSDKPNNCVGPGHEIFCRRPSLRNNLLLESVQAVSGEIGGGMFRQLLYLGSQSHSPTQPEPTSSLSLVDLQARGVFDVFEECLDIGLSPGMVLAINMAINPELLNRNQSDPGSVTPPLGIKTIVTRGREQTVLVTQPRGELISWYSNEQYVGHRKRFKELMRNTLLDLSARQIIFGGDGNLSKDQSLDSGLQNLDFLRTVAQVNRAHPVVNTFLDRHSENPKIIREAILRGLNVMESTPKILIAGPNSGGKSTLLYLIERLLDHYGSQDNQGQLTIQPEFTGNKTKLNIISNQVTCLETDRPNNLVKRALELALLRESSELLVLEMFPPLPVKRIASSGGITKALADANGVSDINELTLLTEHLSPEAQLMHSTFFGLAENSNGSLYPVPDFEHYADDLINRALYELRLVAIPSELDHNFSPTDNNVQRLITSNLSLIMKSLPRALSEMMASAINLRRPLYPVFVTSKFEDTLPSNILGKNFHLLLLLGVLNNLGAITVSADGTPDSVPVLGDKTKNDITLGVNRQGNFNFRNLVMALPETDTNWFNNRMKELKQFAFFMEKNPGVNKEIAQSLYSLIVVLHELYYFHKNIIRKK